MPISPFLPQQPPFHSPLLPLYQVIPVVPSAELDPNISARFRQPGRRGRFETSENLLFFREWAQVEQARNGTYLRTISLVWPSCLLVPASPDTGVLSRGMRCHASASCCNQWCREHCRVLTADLAGFIRCGLGRRRAPHLGSPPMYRGVCVFFNAGSAKGTDRPSVYSVLP